MSEIDKTENSEFKEIKSLDKNGTAIALILVITLAAICGVVIILVAIAFAFDKVSFAETKDIFSLILIALGSTTGWALGFHFSMLKRDS